MHNPYRSISVFAIVALSCSSLLVTANAQTYLNDSFDRTTLGPQDLPDSAQWYSATAGNLSVNNGSMTLSTDSGSVAGLMTAYFTESTPVTVQAGQTLRLSFSFTASGIDASTGYFRFGLFDSGGQRLSEQGQGTSSNIFNNYEGYVVRTNMLSTGNTSINLARRDNLPNQGLMNANGAFTSVGTSGSNNLKLENNVTYTSTLTLMNTGDSMIITQTFSGGTGADVSLTRTDTGESVFTQFDTFALIVQGSALNTITFDNVSVMVIPEPATAAKAMIVSLLLGVVVVRRCRKRRQAA